MTKRVGKVADFCSLATPIYLLNIVHCVDYNTLVALGFTSHIFHSIVQTNAGGLAKRRQMRLHIENLSVTPCDGEMRLELQCDSGKPFTYVIAMKRVASQVGLHSIAALNVANEWRRLPMERLFYASHALRFVETLRINIGKPNGTSVKSVDDVNHFAEQFPGLRRVQLDANEGVPYFDWPAFLQSEGARKLPELVVAGPLASIRRTDGSTSEAKEYDFLQYCFGCSRLAEGVGRFVKMPLTFAVSRSFLVTALRRTAKADRTITVQFRMAGDPNLSADKFSRHQMQQYERTVTHYQSRNSGISVYELNGFFTVTNDPSFDPLLVD
ncbi:hypothetical protein AAVH_25127 [Aphelenchoides avenae]|nr:hypothetical protein AAVH_25127 [Aphelenchus avenae]